MDATTSAATPTADRLLAAIASDEAEAWSRLVREHGPDLLGAATRACGDPDLAEDAVQEALLQIRSNARRFTAPDEGDADRAARAWMRRIARCCALELLRRRARTHRRERRYAGQRAQALAGGVDDHREELARLAPRLHQEMAHLPDAQRQALLLHYGEGLPYDAVATELGCSPGAARVRAHRGLKRLRSRLSAAGILLSAAATGSGLRAGTAVAPTTAPAWLAAGAPPLTTASLPAATIFGGFTTMQTITISGLTVAACALLSLPVLTTPAAEDGVNLIGAEAPKEERAEPAEHEDDGVHQIQGVVRWMDFPKGLVVLRTEKRALELLPRGDDEAILERVRHLRPGAKVTLGVAGDDHRRIVSVELHQNGPERGRFTGTIAELDERKGTVVLEHGEHRIRLVPHWRGGMPKDGGGLDRETIERVAAFEQGDRVTVEWTWAERYRIEAIEAAR